MQKWKNVHHSHCHYLVSFLFFFAIIGCTHICLKWIRIDSRKFPVLKRTLVYILHISMHRLSLTTKNIDEDKKTSHWRYWETWRNLYTTTNVNVMRQLYLFFNRFLLFFYAFILWWIRFSLSFLAVQSFVPLVKTREKKCHSLLVVLLFVTSFVSIWANERKRFTIFTIQSKCWFTESIQCIIGLTHSIRSGTSNLRIFNLSCGC